jgi:hypothetical protein
MSKNSGGALYFSLAEFVWILFFMAMGALALLYVDYNKVKSSLADSIKEITSLKEENQALLIRLEEAEAELGPTPCWQRPESPIPPITAELIIESTRTIRIVSYKGEDQVILLTQSNLEGTHSSDGKAGFLMLEQALKKRFAWEREYASGQNCYIRMKIINHTERYSLYQESASVLKKLGIVVVQED